MKTKHPSGIGEELRELIRESGHTVLQAARAVNVATTTLYELFTEAGRLTPAVAARLIRIGVDGRALYLKQEGNKLAIYEAKEAQIEAANERLGLAGGRKVKLDA